MGLSVVICFFSVKKYHWFISVVIVLTTKITSNTDFCIKLKPMTSTVFTLA